MEVAFEYALLLSPLLLAAALLQPFVRKSLATFGLGVLIAGATALYASIEWGGPGDAAMGTGIVTLYGVAICAVILMVGTVMLLRDWFRPGSAAASDPYRDSDRYADMER